MTVVSSPRLEPEMQRAVDELTALIRTHYPTARFDVQSAPDEASTILLQVTVDVDDPEEVLDLVFERMEQIRIDEGVPILVLPLQTSERAAALLQATRVGREPRFRPLSRKASTRVRVRKER